MTRQLTILGGSSPFVLCLFDAIARSEEPLPFETISLHGRAIDRLEAIRSYGAMRLAPRNISVSWTVSLEEALVGADQILLQIRFGGMEARRRSEEFCTNVAVPADESLGLMGLITACQTRRQVLDLAEKINLHCPSALVVNMINPLTISTAMLAGAGLKVVGICELPKVTLSRIAAAYGCPEEEISFDYTGFNHRGFFFDLKCGDVDLINWIITNREAEALSGFETEYISELNAVPLKYFRMINNPTVGSGRAEFLLDLSNKIATELAADPTRSPPSLTQRQSDWYELAVVPLLEGLVSIPERATFLNLPDMSGLVREYPVAISQGGIRTLNRGGSPSDQVSDWVRKFEEAEQNLMTCMGRMERSTILRAMECDPMISAETPGRIIDEFMALIENDQAECRK